MRLKAVSLCGATGVAMLTAAAALPSPAYAQIYYRGQVCWQGTPCPGFTMEAPKAAPARAIRPVLKARPQPATPARAVKPSPPPKQSPTETKAATVRVYRYPSMYRAEAPPLMPPGAVNFPPFVQQPYVLVSQGIWYWPGANDFRMPHVPGFEPVIDPSRVVSW